MTLSGVYVLFTVCLILAIVVLPWYPTVFTGILTYYGDIGSTFRWALTITLLFTWLRFTKRRRREKKAACDTLHWWHCYSRHCYPVVLLGDAILLLQPPSLHLPTVTVILLNIVLHLRLLPLLLTLLLRYTAYFICHARWVHCCSPHLLW